MEKIIGPQLLLGHQRLMEPQNLNLKSWEGTKLGMIHKLHDMKNVQLNCQRLVNACKSTKPFSFLCMVWSKIEKKSENEE